MADEPYLPQLVVRRQHTPDFVARQFDVWERRGRGWQVFDYPVELEPSFQADSVRGLSQQAVRDDARRPTLVGSIIERMRRRAPVQAQKTPATSSSKQDITLPARASETDEPVCEMQLYLPAKLKVSAEVAEQLLLSLCYATRPLSFEVIGVHESIYVQYTCHNRDREQVLHQLKSHFPEAVIGEEQWLLEKSWAEQPNCSTVIADFGLAHSFVLPLQTSSSLEADPLVAITGALAALAPDEVGCLQVIFQAAQNPWAERVARLLAGADAKAIFARLPEMAAMVKRKISRPLFAAVIRVAAQSQAEARAWHIVKAIGGGLAQFANPLGNSFIPLSNDGYAHTDHKQALLKRQTFRSGMLLNSEELVSLVHPPSAAVRVGQLKRVGQKTKAAPAITRGHSLILGENQHGGVTQQITLSAEQRTRHLYTIGSSGTGKSTLLLSCIIQDIEQGNGVAVCDPHGDLIDQILARIPEARFDDVVLFDPSDEEYPIGFNMLSAHSELEKTLLASDLVGVFRRLSTSWGDQMNSVLSNAILAFLESECGGTLSDMRRFLVEQNFRYQFLETVRDPDVVYYWLKEFPLLTGRPQAPLLTRLDTFLRPKPIRYMVAQKENRIDFAKVMNESKIFLAKLSQGAIGEENSYLLGSLLISKFHQMALSRQELSQAARREFWLYIDEFQNFITPSMASILSGARKYRLGLVLAHQELRQLLSKDVEVASAVITNPYTRICFRVGDDDARKLSEGFVYFNAEDLQNLGIGQAICRIERAEYDFNLHTFPLPEVDQHVAEERRVEIQARSRQKYARQRAEIEAELANQHSQISVATAKAEKQRTASMSRRPERLTEVPNASLPSAAITEPEVSTEQPPQIELTTPSEAVIEQGEAKRTVRKRVKATPVETLQSGKGGQQHKYLQHLIKRWGEERGYKSTIEKQIAGGSVDVALEKDGSSVACEISVTTTAEHEVQNIKKCLEAGFNQVIVITSDKKMLGKIKNAAAASLDAQGLSSVQFFLPEDLFMFLEQIAAESEDKEAIIKGYKVKVKLRTPGIEEQKARKEVIAKTVLQAMKRLKENR